MHIPTSAAPLFELDLLRTLVAISETGNFSAAADRLGRTPSAVSMQVKKMEQLVGRAVFNRDSRSVSLTRDGEALLQHARRLLAMNRDMMTRFAHPDLVGEVHLGAPDDVAERFLPAMLRQFAERYPRIILNVLVDGTKRLIEAVGDGGLDLAVVTCESGFDTEGKAEVVFREPMVWACLAGGIAAEQKPLRVSMWEDGCLWRRAALNALNEDGRDYQIAFQSSNISGQRAALLADLAVAPLARSHIHGPIAEVSPAAELPKLPTSALGILMAEDPSAPVEAAAELIRDCFATHPANHHAQRRRPAA
ncbi:MAG: LysR family transcriptional regulator [Devosiaceae bacterium]|nr:LysR family transcriptional regulator [Devosiaceae bacterium MH13]